MATYSTSKAGEAAGISASSVRSYVKLFPQYFSEMATPEEGEARAFNDDDVAKLRFISDCKTQRQTDEEIDARLNGGEWTAIREEIAREQIEEGSDKTQLAIRLSAAYAQIEAMREQNISLADTLNSTRQELQDTYNRLIEAEKRAAVGDYRAEEVDRLREERAATAEELERLRLKLEQLEAALTEERGKGWWGKLRGR